MIRGKSGPLSRSLAACRGVVFSARSVHFRHPMAGVRAIPWCPPPKYTMVPPLRGTNVPALLGARGLSEIKVDFIDPAVARKLVEEEGALILDVRGGAPPTALRAAVPVLGSKLTMGTEREFATGALPGAKNIPHDDPDLIEMVADMTSADLQKPIVVYDKVGRRAETAKATLNKAGHKNVVNLGGVDQLKMYLELSAEV